VNTIEDSYGVVVHGANGYKHLGNFFGTPEDIFEESVEDEIDDDLGEFIDVLFRRNGERDVFYKADGTWTLGEMYVKPPDHDAELRAMIESLEKLRAGKQ
jgi:hypothetical protein